MTALAVACSIEDLRKHARRRLPRAVFDFFDGGAEDELTLADNRAAFERVRLRPRVLVDVSSPQLSTSMFGKPLSLPLVIAPTGAIGAGWPRADILIATAAADLGIPYTLSTTATSSIEEVADQAGGRLWFQLYVLRDPAFTERLVARAESAGYEALVVTLDLATGGKRERDLHNRFTLPLRPRPRELIDYARHPRWWIRLLRGGLPHFANLEGLQNQAGTGASIAALVGRSLDAGFDWTALSRLRERWHGRLIVKGVQRGDDAARLVELGVDAIWVSNHGGRQLDGAMAALDSLPDVAASVSRRVPLIIDSGVRRGTDLVKAVALGATACAIGRPTLYGVASAGEAGARRALAILQEEFMRTMQLCGMTSVNEISADLLDPQSIRSGGHAGIPWMQSQ